MSVNSEAISILSETLASATRRDQASHPISAGLEPVLNAISQTVLPRRLTFQSGEQTLEMVASSGRLMRMTDPSLEPSDKRKAQLVGLAAILRAYPAEEGQLVTSEHLPDDIAAEEVGFSAAELREQLSAPVQEFVEDDAPEPQADITSTGVRGFFETHDGHSDGQAYLLPTGEEVEITGDDILPESDEEMGQLIAEVGFLKEVVAELCGEEALLMAHDGSGVVSVVFSTEGEVLSSFSDVAPDAVADSWARFCLEEKG